MAITYHEAQIRARLKTVVAAVTGIGMVYDHERHADDWKDLLALMAYDLGGGVKRLQAWTIQLASLDQLPAERTFGERGGFNTEVDCRYVIRGVYAVADAADASSPSEKAFVALTLSLLAALDADAQLNAGSFDAAGNKYVSDPCSRAAWDYRMLSDVLVHYVEITKVLKEYV